MAGFAKGHPKWGGRAKGYNAKDRLVELYGLIEEEFPGYHPIKRLIQIAEHPLTDEAVAAGCHKEVAKYMLPQLKQVEVIGTGDDGEIQHSHEVRLVFVRKDKAKADET